MSRWCVRVLCIALAYTSLAESLQVIHLSDGGADDFVTTCVVALDQEADLKGVVITNADCVPEFAVSSYKKLFRLLNQSIPCGISHSKSWNQFPWSWRADTIRLGEIESFAAYGDIHPEHSFIGDQLLVDVLNKAKEKEMIVLATGPLNTLADVLKQYPHLENRIHSMYWMGGAVDVPGNLRDAEIHPAALNDEAEWNAFADAFSVDWVFENTTFDIYLIPLDVTNHAKVSQDFLVRLDNLSKNGSRIAQFVSEAYRSVWELGAYYMWDVVAGMAMLHPDSFEKPVDEMLKIRTDLDSHGALIRDQEGRLVHVYYEFKDGDPERFFDRFLEYMH